jgi:hypothetical protein
MNVPREINADAAKRLATEKHTPMMHGSRETWIRPLIGPPV